MVDSFVWLLGMGNLVAILFYCEHTESCRGESDGVVDK
jgi:hypothetical protein